jgi:hypothetical protein
MFAIDRKPTVVVVWLVVWLIGLTLANDLVKPKKEGVALEVRALVIKVPVWMVET